MDPVLGHEVVVVGGEVDRLDRPPVVVEEAADIDQEDDLQGLYRTDEGSGRGVGVHVDYLSARCDTETGQDGNRTGVDDGADEGDVDLGRLADQPVLLPVDVVGFEGAGRETVGGNALLPYRLDQEDVLLDEGVTRRIEHVGLGDSEPVDLPALDPALVEGTVQLGATAMDHDRREPDGVEERQGSCRFFQVLGEDGAADLDHCETGPVHLGESLQVGADLSPVTHIGEKMDDGLAHVPVLRSRDPVLAHCPIRLVMIAFCTWRRFSASS